MSQIKRIKEDYGAFSLFINYQTLRFHHNRYQSNLNKLFGRLNSYNKSI